MAKVITFWRLPEEEPEFLDYLERSGDVLAFPMRNAPSPAELQADPVRDLIASDPDSMLLTLSSLAKDVVIAKGRLGEDDIFAPDLMRTPGIAYDRGRLVSEKELGSSNLAYYTSFPSTDASNLIKKPESFLRWADKVFRWVRSWTPEWHEYRSYRVTRRVKQAIEEGLRIVP